MKLFLGVFLLFLLFPSAALAGGKICDLNTKPLSQELQRQAKEVELSSGPVDRSRSATEAPVMDKNMVRSMLSASWRAFGYRGEALTQRVRLNMMQIKADSSYRPHIEGLLPEQTAVPELGRPGGLFAFFGPLHSEWKDYASWRGAASKFNPLSNIFAAVSAQVHGKKIFAGQGRISVPKNNPCN